jgi:putative endonuclease
MSAPKRVVYVLVSDSNPSRHYVGVTSDVPRRLAVHNSGGSRHTANDRPWRLIVSLEFARERSALNFERYLKSGSGRAFAKRHLV